MTGFQYRYKWAEKPIKVVHFHPDDERQWNCMVNGENDLGIKIINQRLIEIFEKHDLRWKEKTL